jgi:hypothetical protein
MNTRDVAKVDRPATENANYQISHIFGTREESSRLDRILKVVR